jgi:hypothetical protein
MLVTSDEIIESTEHAQRYFGMWLYGAYKQEESRYYLTCCSTTKK